MNKNYWFEERPYSITWRMLGPKPITWQGWLSLLFYLAGIVFLIVYFTNEDVKTVLSLAAWVIGYHFFSKSKARIKS